jgi:hypothetical protein
MSMHRQSDRAEIYFSLGRDDRISLMNQSERRSWVPPMSKVMMLLMPKPLAGAHGSDDAAGGAGVAPLPRVFLPNL